MDLDFLKPIYQLVQNEAVREKVAETARLYWSPDLDGDQIAPVTVNLIPSLIVLTLLALVALPLLGVPIFDMLGDSMAHLSNHGLAARGDTDFQAIADLQQQVADLQEYYGSTVDTAAYYSDTSSSAGYST